MTELRSKIRALLGAALSEEMTIDLIIDVVARGLGKLGGRPAKEPARAFTPAATPVAALPAIPDTETNLSLRFEATEPVSKPAETSISSVPGSESALILSSPSGPSKTSSLDRRSDGPLPPGFGDFWALYPRRVGKADAIKSWKKLQPPLDVVRTALIWQIEAWDAESPPRPIEKIPHPATWLNGRRWLDERPEPRRVAQVVSQKSRAQMENLMAIAQRGARRDDT